GHGAAAARGRRARILEHRLGVRRARDVARRPVSAHARPRITDPPGPDLRARGIRRGSGIEIESADGGMTLDVIDDINALAELAPEWRELVQNSAAPSPFLTPEWLLAWWTHLAGSRTLHVLVVREEGRLMALAPLLVARGPLGVGSRLEFLGAGHAGSDYLDVIVRAGHEH